MVHKAELDEKQAEIDEIRKKLVERTEAMTAEINELKPEADEGANNDRLIPAPAVYLESD